MRENIELLLVELPTNVGRLFFSQEFAANSQLVKNGLSHLFTKLNAIEAAVRANSVASAVERAVDDTIRPAVTESVRSTMAEYAFVQQAASLTRNDLIELLQQQFSLSVGDASPVAPTPTDSAPEPVVVAVPDVESAGLKTTWSVVEQGLSRDVLLPPGYSLVNTTQLSDAMKWWECGKVVAFNGAGLATEKIRAFRALRVEDWRDTSSRTQFRRWKCVLTKLEILVQLHGKQLCDMLDVVESCVEHFARVYARRGYSSAPAAARLNRRGPYRVRPLCRKMKTVYQHMVAESDDAIQEWYHAFVEQRE